MEHKQKEQYTKYGSPRRKRGSKKEWLRETVEMLANTMTVIIL